MSHRKKTWDEVLQGFRKVHGDKYEYDSSSYDGSAYKMRIFCSTHGWFEQTPNKHLLGRGCPDCGGRKRLTREEVIRRCEERYPVLYSYDKLVYVNNEADVTITCKKHGDFTTNIRKFITGCGCPVCKQEREQQFKDSFEERARKVHKSSEELDYSEAVYVNNHTLLKIICHKKDEFGKEHGAFWQTPAHHLSGERCPKCYGNAKYTTDEIIRKFKHVHGDEYDYSNVLYTDYNTEVEIICKQHGLFMQTPHNHINGKGCPVCRYDKIRDKLAKSTEDFVRQAKEVHGDKYQYDKTEYIQAKGKVIITCPIHGDFEQEASSHIMGCGCPYCAHSSFSEAEEEIANELERRGVIVEKRNRDIIDGKELDIVVPDKRIAIEYDGMIWHSEKFNKDRWYHLNKTIKANNAGYGLIHVFESEYLSNKQLVIDKILHLVGLNKNKKIGARKCTISEVSSSEARAFLTKNHIQGFVASTLYIGGYYNNELISVMSFKCNNNDKWELTRFASSGKYIIQGIAGKLFSYFIKQYSPEIVTTFADRRWTLSGDNNLYTNLGFKLVKTLDPDYRYTRSGKEHIHKSNFRKKNLNRKYGFPMTMTETEMTKQLGYYKIWDCGLFKYEYKNKD